MDLIIRVKRFIEKEWDRKSPLLLGYSGGGDSKSLLYALLETAAAKFLHLAHVDHGWREESAHEAALLSQEAARLQLPFYTIRLTEQPTHNLEEAGRLARLSFFKSLFDKWPFQALLLAHHKGDVAETALKRLLEGAHLQNVGGMTPISCLHEMTVWRPLLGVKKSALTQSGFIDPTNSNPKFLRSRLRLNIIPTLSESFGKEVSDNLAVFSERASELREYLDRKIASIEVLEGPWGKAANLQSVERIEARHLLLKWGGSSRENLESILNSGLNNSSGTFGPFIVDRGWVFLPASTLPAFGEEIFLAPGRHVSGDWVLEVEKGAATSPLLSSDVWRGTFSAMLPHGVLKKEKFEAEEYRAAKLPPFLRAHLPLINGKTLFAKQAHPHWQVRFFVNASQTR